jgi:hypothetical protein
LASGTIQRNDDVLFTRTKYVSASTSISITPDGTGRRGYRVWSPWNGAFVDGLAVVSLAGNVAVWSGNGNLTASISNGKLVLTGTGNIYDTVVVQSYNPFELE